MITSATINGQAVVTDATVSAALPAEIVIALPNHWPGAWIVVNNRQPGFGLRKSAGVIRIKLEQHGVYEIRYANALNGNDKAQPIRFTLAAAQASKWGKGIISDVGTTGQLVSTFGPMGVNAMRHWISYDATSGVLTGAGRILHTNEAIKAGWICDPVLSNSQKPRSVTMPDINSLAKTLSKDVAGIGCQNEIDHDDYWPAGTTPAGFARGVQHSQAIADKLRSLGFRADSFSLSRINAGEIAASWKAAMALGCTRFDAIRGHAYDWNFDGNPATFLLKMERIITEYYGVAQALGLPLKIDEIGLPPSGPSRRTMSAEQIAYVVPKLWGMLKRYTVASYLFIATPTNRMPHDAFPRLVDDLVQGTRTPFGRAFALI